MEFRKGAIVCQEPAAIFDLTMIALESEESGWTEAEGSKVDLAQYVVDFLKAKSELLSDYFSMDIDEVRGAGSECCPRPTNQCLLRTKICLFTEKSVFIASR